MASRPYLVGIGRGYREGKAAGHKGPLHLYTASVNFTTELRTIDSCDYLRKYLTSAAYTVTSQSRSPFHPSWSRR